MLGKKLESWGYNEKLLLLSFMSTPLATPRRRREGFESPRPHKEGLKCGFNNSTMHYLESAMDFMLGGVCGRFLDHGNKFCPKGGDTP